MNPFIIAMQLTVATSLSAQPLFNVKDYGAVGDGKANDIAAFRNVAAAVCRNGGGTVVFEKGKTYLVKLDKVEDERPGSRLQDNATMFDFTDCNSVNVSMNDAIIILAPNHRMEYAFFRFMNCKNFSLSRGSLIGDAAKHDYSDIVRYGKKQKSSHEWGFGVLVNGSKGVIRDMQITNMTGDGIKSGSINLKNKGIYHTSLTVDNTEISYCRRNGIAILSSLGTRIENTHIHHIGTYGNITGTAPQAGIDLEYEDGVGDAGDVTIRNCRISDCTQKVISASNSTPPTPRKLLIEKCYLEGSNFQIANTKPVKCMTVSNCTVVHCPINLGKAKVTNTTFDLRQSVNYVSGGDYCNCSFKGVLDGLESVHGCTITGTNLDEAKFTDCTFADIRAANNNSPAYQGFSAYNFPLCASFYRCNFTNCSFVRGNPKYASSFSFYSSELSDGCMIYNENDDIPVTFSKCTLTDVSAYQTQKGRFQFTKSTIIQCDTSVSQPLLLFGTNTLVRCNVIDNVGFPESAKRHGIKAYKLDASRSNIEMTSGHVVTAGMALTKGSVKGVDKESFKGNDTSVKFK